MNVSKGLDNERTKEIQELEDASGLSTTVIVKALLELGLRQLQVEAKRKARLVRRFSKN